MSLTAIQTKKQSLEYTQLADPLGTTCGKTVEKNCSIRHFDFLFWTLTSRSLVGGCNRSWVVFLPLFKRIIFIFDPEGATGTSFETLVAI
jgi:hypothetical protein